MTATGCGPLGHGRVENATMVRKDREIVATFKFKGQIIVATGRGVTILSNLSY